MKIFNVPNLLSLSRILSVPVFIILMLEPSPARALAAGIVFSLASATDWLDGYLARKWGQVTKMGKLLDPIADKILIMSALVILVELRADVVPREDDGVDRVAIVERSPLEVIRVFLPTNQATCTTPSSLAAMAAIKEICAFMLRESVWCHAEYVLLKADPQDCYERLRGRRRESERCVPLDYLMNLHDRYECMFAAFDFHTIDGSKGHVKIAARIADIAGMSEEFERLHPRYKRKRDA